ncbi:5-formyltetrahydrofolate cyclo-ligase, partial [Candidatus Desantisbacteria bacterium]|nr:5-formyltetrahydrofolate cyclo-ligase [Candidatus Desantisbacteria bacterium]
MENIDFENKQYYRKLCMDRRLKLDKDEVFNKSKKIYENVISLKEIKQASRIFCYLSSEEKNEVNTGAIILWLLNNKKEVYIPKTDWKEKKIKIYNLPEYPLPPHKFVKKHGIMEPVNEYFTEYLKKDMDVLILPGTSGDVNGIRYGYGSGFFDRMLVSLSNSKYRFISI